MPLLKHHNHEKPHEEEIVIITAIKLLIILLNINSKNEIDRFNIKQKYQKGNIFMSSRINIYMTGVPGGSVILLKSIIQENLYWNCLVSKTCNL